MCRMLRNDIDLKKIEIEIIIDIENMIENVERSK